MPWELLAIWLIVTATLVWFIRDEKRLRQEKLAEKARLYATGAAWRHRAGAGLAVAAPSAASHRNPTALQTKFLEELRRAR